MNKVTASSLLLVLQRVAERSLGLVSTLILARLITPEDFGIIAIAMLILWFTEALSNAGTSAYIIQKESVSTEELNSAWTLDLILKNLSFILMIISAPIISSFHESNSLAYVVSAIAFTLPIAAIRNPGIWLLSRDQKYSGIVKISVLTKVFGLFVMVPLAYYFQSFWAIVSGHIVSVSLKTVLSYKISNYRPSLNRSHIARQWQFSKWLIPQSILGYFRNQVDTLIVSNRFVSSDLGAYNNLKYFASIPMLQIMTPLAEPLHAEMGKVQNSRFEMQFQSSIAVKLMGFIAAPFAAMFFVCSEVIVLIFLGEQWVEYHRIFSYFGLMIIPFILFTQSSRILMVKGHTKSIFSYEVFCTIFIAVFLFSLPLSSIDDFALFRIVSESFMSFLLYCYATKKVFGSVGIRPCLILLAPTIITTVMLLALKNGIFLQWNLFSQFLMLGILNILMVIILFVVWWRLLASKRERMAIQKFSPFVATRGAKS